MLLYVFVLFFTGWSKEFRPSFLLLHSFIFTFAIENHVFLVHYHQMIAQKLYSLPENFDQLSDLNTSYNFSVFQPIHISSSWLFMPIPISIVPVVSFLLSLVKTFFTETLSFLFFILNNFAFVESVMAARNLKPIYLWNFHFP